MLQGIFTLWILCILFPWDTWVLEVFQGWTRFIPSRKGCHIKSFFTCFFTRMNFTIPLRQGVSYHIYSLPLKWSCFSYFSRKNNFVPVFVTRSNGLWKESLVAGISLYHSLSRQKCSYYVNIFHHFIKIL